ncbi:MAG: TRAP transporter small permease [Spirochaetia bacterium]|nr:TRAP transporter small permease [Spirochaetia bacterium]MCF7942352.1 TRAP transporter small permease [Spirochaetia bacterium]
MKFRDVLWKIIDGILFAEVLGMLIVVSIQIIGRLVGNSVAWSEEMTRNLFVWTINFGMVVGFRRAEHARVTFVYDLFPKTPLMKNIQLGIYMISCLLFFSVAAYWNAGMTIRQIGSGEMSPALGIPMFFVTLPLSLCSVLAIIAIIQSVLLDPETRESLTCDEPVELQKERTV